MIDDDSDVSVTREQQARIQVSGHMLVTLKSLQTLYSGENATSTPALADPPIFDSCLQ